MQAAERYSDTDYERTAAEHHLGVGPKSLNLNELAKRLSVLRPRERVNVRDSATNPTTWSFTYQDGVRVR